MGILKDIGGPVAEVLGSTVSSVMGYSSAKKQMEFQREMSGTAHQREVEDLRKAGLNPILSAGGPGASTPAGTAFTPENPLKGMSANVMDIIMKRENAKLMGVQNLKTSEEAKTEVLKQGLTSAQQAVELSKVKLQDQELRNLIQKLAVDVSQESLNSALKVKSINEAEEALARRELAVMSTTEKATDLAQRRAKEWIFKRGTEDSDLTRVGRFIEMMRQVIPFVK